MVTFIILAIVVIGAVGAVYLFTHSVLITGVLALLLAGGAVLASPLVDSGVNNVGNAISSARADGSRNDNVSATATRVSGNAGTVATATPTGSSSSGGSSGNTGSSVINLLDGRSMDARTTAVNSTLGFSPYQDTGVGKTANYSFRLPAGWTATVFGVTVVDNNTKTKHDRGFMMQYKGPMDVNVTIIDGAYSVKPNDQSCGDALSRIQQHRDNGWLMSEAQLLDNCKP